METTLKIEEERRPTDAGKAMRGYFDKVVASLDSYAGNSADFGVPNFVRIKKWEYWYRFIQSNAPFQDSSIGRIMSSLPVDEIVAVAREAGGYLELGIADEWKRLETRIWTKTEFLRGQTEFDDGEEVDLREDEIEKVAEDGLTLQLKFRPDAVPGSRLQFASDCPLAKRIELSEKIKWIESLQRRSEEAEQGDVKRGLLLNIIDNVWRSSWMTQDGKDFFLKTVAGAFLASLKKTVCDETDPHFRRLVILRKALELDDGETEFVLFAWIYLHRRFNDDLGDRSMSSEDRSRRRFQEAYPEIRLERLLRADRTLRKMHAVDDSGELSKQLVAFLDGYAGDDLASLFCKIYEGNCVPYERLAAGRPEVSVFFDMLKHAEPGKPLNLRRYGVEGTGKTELVKSVARELGRPLVFTNLSTEGSNRETKEDSPIRSRLASIAYAAHKYRDGNAILLVDEADVVLNGCEKGALNFFLEESNVPIVWISNNIGLVEASTRRRFDFSLKFERLDAAKRLEVWRSVIQARGAEGLLADEETERLATEIPVAAGGATLAVAAALRLKRAGVERSAYELARTIASSQLELLELKREQPAETRAPGYSLEALSVEGDLERVERIARRFDERWKAARDGDRPESLNVLLYGPPGTGKTEFARRLARTLERKLLVKRASDLLGMYVGETEKKIAAMFRQAEKEKAILFLDEADSLLRDRAGAARSWEATQVNELLTQMENFTGIFVAATNFEQSLDDASNRRFALKLKFGFLKPEGIRTIWEIFFPDVPVAEEALSLRNLAPGDFNAVHGAFRWCTPEEVTGETVLAALKREIAAKKHSGSGGKMGF